MTEISESTLLIGTNNCLLEVRYRELTRKSWSFFNISTRNVRQREMWIRIWLFPDSVHLLVLKPSLTKRRANLIGQTTFSDHGFPLLARPSLNNLGLNSEYIEIDWITSLICLIISEILVTGNNSGDLGRFCTTMLQNKYFEIKKMYLD